MWVSANPMMDSDVGTDRTVQCWQGDLLRSLTTKQEQDSICKEVIGHTISQKITPELAVASNNKDENTHSRKEGPEFETETLLDDVSSNYDELKKNSGSSFPAINKDDDVWIYEDEYRDDFSSDNEDSEEMHKDSIPSSAAEAPSLVQQDYMGPNLTVSIEVGDNHNEISRGDESINSTIHFLRTHGFIPGDIGVGFDDFNGEYEDSEEMDRNSTSHLSAEIHSLDHQNDMNINLTVSMKAGENHTEVSRRDEVRDSTIKFPSLSYGFIPEDIEDSYYDYEFYGEYQDSEELYKDNISPFSAETTNLKPEDDNVFADVHYILENSDLQESDTKRQTTISTTGLSSQNNDSVMDGSAPDSSSLRISNSNLTDSDKYDTLNNSRDYEKCISCGDNAVPSTKTPSLKHENEYEFTETSIFFENINSEGTAIKDETADYTIQFSSIYDDFSLEDNGDPFAFLVDDLGSEEVANNEISPSATNFPDLIEEDNFDIASVLKSFYSDADDQEHTTVMNRINDKPPNRLNLKMLTIIKFLILAGMVSVVVFVLIVTIYCISNVFLTSVLSRQVIVYKRMEKCAAKGELLQDV
jgi:hypothetical protein